MIKKFAIFTIAVLLAFAFLVGVITSSTAVSIMTTYGLFFLSAILVNHERIEAAIASEWRARTVHWLYLIFPKTADMGKAVIALVSGGEAPARLSDSLTLAPFATTAAFGLGCLILASLLFQRKEF